MRRDVPTIGYAKWITPSLGDLLPACLIGWLFAAGQGWSVLLADGDTGWHIRAGDWILAHRAIPTRDLFSFSRPEAPWFSWEWLADVVFSLVHRHSGLAGVAVLCGCLLAASALLVFRCALRRGAHALLALATVLVAVGACSIHFLARPHVFTLLFVPLSVWLIDRDRRRPGRAIWWLVPLSALWVNLHGGFFALPASLALLAGGMALEAGLGLAAWDTCRRYAGLCAATLAASVMNPYGIALHRHVFGYLTSDWIRNSVDEFQAPRFRGENLLHFELLLLAALLLAGWWVSRGRLADALLVAGWAHLALTSVRHVPVFALIAAPLVAAGASSVAANLAGSSPPRSARRIVWDLGNELRPGFSRLSLWAPALAIGMILLTPSGRWPGDFPEAKFPVSLIRAHAAHLTRGRVFTSDQWGDYLIYHHWPGQRVFLDGRSDFYGPGLGGDYLALLEGRPGWETLINKYAFDVLLVPAAWPLTSLLARDARWQRLAADRTAVLYVPAAPSPPQANHKVPASR